MVHHVDDGASLITTIMLIMRMMMMLMMMLIAATFENWIEQSEENPTEAAMRNSIGWLVVLIIYV